MVVGYQKDSIMNTVHSHVSDVQFVVQEQQCGTGHALACSQDVWKEDTLLVLNSDAPLITQNIIEQLYHEHMSTNATISFVTSHTNDIDSSYGRVIKKENSIEIVEANELGDSKADHCCINAGIYLINRQFLYDYLNALNKNNLSKEFYITDLIKIASDNNYTVTTRAAPFDTIRGINTVKELWQVEHIKKSEIINYWMSQGVYFATPQNVSIDLSVIIGPGTRIGSGVHLLGKTKIGSNCTINSFSIIENSDVADNVIVHSHSVIYDSSIGHGAQVGPFAHIRLHSTLENNSVIGNFVELKNTQIGSATKAKHLSYLGDARIGSHVNIGAGTIICNFNGKEKNTTTIKDGAYIGSLNALIAPVTIEKNAFTAAGSVITHDVPEDALAIARAYQVNKEGYAKKLRATQKDKPITPTHDNTSTAAHL
jgi:bifunctional UDP-N-acetylglucosamine pyrophosphorylase/glucosamine-1-phosphate N-acetyltransferase